MNGSKDIYWKALENVSFFVFLFSVFFSIRKVITTLTPLEGTPSFNEYTDISLYFSDITLAAFLIIVILRNRLYHLSIIKEKMFHVEHVKGLIYFPLLLSFWAFISIIWSLDKDLWLYSSFKLLEIIFLYTVLILSNVPRGTYLGSKTFLRENEKDSLAKMFHVEHEVLKGEDVPRGTFKKFLMICSTWNIFTVFFYSFIVFSTFQALIGIIQFFLKRSLGIPYIESVISASTPGVAKIHLGGEILIRAYGFFPHPNILGAFLGLSLAFLVAYPLIFHKKMFHVEHYFLKAFVFIQTLGLFLTFSKSTWIATITSLGILMFHVEHLDLKGEDVPRGTWEKIKKMFHVEHSNLSLLIIGILALFTVFFILSVNQSISERLFYLQAFSSLEVQDWLLGIGIGQFVFGMQTFFSEPLLFWQFQPVHSVYLLPILEIGLIGSLLFYLFLFSIGKFIVNVPRGTFKALFFCVYVYFLVLFLFDHFFWDIEQGRILFWLTMGIFISLSFRMFHVEQSS